LSIEGIKELLRFLFLPDVEVISSGAKSRRMNVLPTKTKSATSVVYLKMQYMKLHNENKKNSSKYNIATFSFSTHFRLFF
jgi:hypothetical protein